MATRRDFDDRPLAKRKRPLPAWALALVVAVPVLVCGGGSMAVIAALSAATRGGPSGDAADLTRVWDEDELLARIRGKRAADVVKVLGQPDRTYKDPEKDGEAVFNYYKRLKSPYRAEPDTITVRFRGGVVQDQLR